MSIIFNELQVFGWEQQLENLLLSTILTGDRALLISQPGAAKTLLPQKLAKVMGVTFAPFDLNAVSFDDILGVLDIPKMQKGEMAFIQSPGTIWGKNFVVYEEINRCKPAIQGKVLEHLRSGTVGGVSTDTKWCWANMNPVGHAGANKLTPAIVDRFSIYVWAPDALSMSTSDRALIASAMSKADAPALGSWLVEAGLSQSEVARTQDTTDYPAVGKMLKRVMVSAAKFWVQVEKDYPNLSEFLSLFSDSLCQAMKEVKDDKSPPPVRLSGRRLAYIRRTIIAYRAIELALDAELNVHCGTFRNSISIAINAAIPVGINEEEAPHKKMREFINTAIRNSYHAIDTKDAAEQRMQHDLFSSRDPLERARILLSGKITSEEILNTGWQRITSMNERGAKLLAFVAINLDARLRSKGKNGVLPVNVLEAMKKKVNKNHVDPELPKLPGQLMPSISDLNKIIEDSNTRDPIEALIAIEAIHEAVVEEPDANFNKVKRRINDKQQEFRELIAKFGI